MTLVEVVVGFAIGVVIGLALALPIAYSAIVRAHAVPADRRLAGRPEDRDRPAARAVARARHPAQARDRRADGLLPRRHHRGRGLLVGRPQPARPDALGQRQPVADLPPRAVPPRAAADLLGPEDRHHARGRRRRGGRVDRRPTTGWATCCCRPTPSSTRRCCSRRWCCSSCSASCCSCSSRSPSGCCCPGATPPRRAALRLTTREEAALHAPYALFACASGSPPPGVAGCGDDEESGSSAPSGTKTEKVTFRLNWVIAGNHAPFYLAKEKGYWQDCGLDVDDGGRQGLGRHRAARGHRLAGLRAHRRGLDRTPGGPQGLPIKSLGVVYQTNPSSFVSEKDKGITASRRSPARPSARCPAARRTCSRRRCSRRTASKPGKEVNVPAPGIAQLKTGQVDFITFFGNEAANIDPDWQENLNVAYFKDAGQDIYGLTLAASDEYASGHAKQVECFRDGVTKGFEEAKADPEAALEALKKAVPATGSNPDVQQAAARRGVRVHRRRAAGGERRALGRDREGASRRRDREEAGPGEGDHEQRPVGPTLGGERRRWPPSRR